MMKKTLDKVSQTGYNILSRLSEGTSSTMSLDEYLKYSRKAFPKDVENVLYHQFREITRDNLRLVSKTLMENREKNKLPPFILAGGVIRDIVIGKKPKDYDVFILAGDISKDEMDDIGLLYGEGLDDLTQTDAHDYSPSEPRQSFATSDVNKDDHLSKSFSVFDAKFDGVENNIGLFGVAENGNQIQVQLIVRPEETVEELLSDFDYSLVRSAYDPDEDVVSFDRKTWDNFIQNRAYEFPSKASFQRGFVFKSYCHHLDGERPIFACKMTKEEKQEHEKLMKGYGMVSNTMVGTGARLYINNGE